MSRCTCDGTGWSDVECPTHGLPDGAHFPPMDRHARDIEEVLTYESRGHTFTHTVIRKETAAEVQRRLYAEARAA